MITAEQRKLYNAARRKKYRNDPVFRAAEIARKMKNYTFKNTVQNRDCFGRFVKITGGNGEEQ